MLLETDQFISHEVGRIITYTAKRDENISMLSKYTAMNLLGQLHVGGMRPSTMFSQTRFNC